MASKQLGKFRQWAGEKISAEKKTVATEEFKDMERDVELRRAGMQELHSKSEIYYKFLATKKTYDNDDKLAPAEALGLIMKSHGQEFGDHSAYGQSLCKFGTAHVRIAELQQDYAESFKRAFLSGLEQSLAEVEEYHSLRKKMKSRRLAYDAAITHSEKVFKKEKEKEDAEQELVSAKERFEKISEQVQAQMTLIQDREIEQFRDLSRLLDVELAFAQRYLDVLVDLKRDWLGESEIRHVPAGKIRGPSHIRPDSHERDRDRDRDPDPDPEESSEAERDENHTERDNNEERTDDRSDKIHKRSHSGNTIPRRTRSALAGWTTFIKKDKASTFETLDGEEKYGFKASSTSENLDHTDASNGSNRIIRAAPPPPLRPRSQSRTQSPRQPLKTLRSVERLKGPDAKTMRAIYDFIPSNSDELALSIGDEIIVLSEPSDTWWRGKSCRTGKEGIFPVNYTDLVPKAPPLPARPPSLKRRGSEKVKADVVEEKDTNDHDVKEGVIFYRSRTNSVVSNKLSKKEKEKETSYDDDEPFGDRYEYQGLLDPPTSSSPTTTQHPHHHQQQTSVDNESRGLMDLSPSYLPHETGGSQPNKAPIAAAGSMVRKLTHSFSAKKPPPPPPTRKNTGGSRSASNSVSGSPFLTPTTSGTKFENGTTTTTTKSPFDGDDDYMSDSHSHIPMKLN